MKKLISMALMLSMMVSLLVGCASKEPVSLEPGETSDTEEIESTEKIELIVFAAASMTETLLEIEELYKEVAPEVDLVFNFDSSGTLKTQIEEGAECDVFISAAYKQMDALDVVLEESRIDLLENKVSLVVPEGNPKNITSYEDLMKKLEDGSVLLAMGNGDVPVGQYTRKILIYYGLSEEALAKQGSITYGSNVKEVTTQIAEATVDCGIIYGTDAYSAGLTVVDTATEEQCGRVLYPAAVLTVSKHQTEAQDFLDYLQGEKAGAVFEAVGFANFAK